MSLVKEEKPSSDQTPKTLKDDAAPSEPDNSLKLVKEDYDQLCCELNMDQSTMEAAWKSYIAIRHNYTLEASHVESCFKITLPKMKSISTSFFCTLALVFTPSNIATQDQ